MKMKGFGKCLKMDLQSVWGETLTACIILYLSYIFFDNVLLLMMFSTRATIQVVIISLAMIALVGYCMYRVMKKLFFTDMFTDGAILYKSLPVTAKTAAISKLVLAGGSLTVIQLFAYALQWYILHNRLTEFQSREFQMRTLNEYNAFMDALGGVTLETAAASFALAALIFAAIAVYQTARNKSGGRKFLAVLAIAGVSFAAALATEVITNVFDLDAGASGVAEAVIRTAIAIVCLKIVIKRVQAGAN